LTKLEESVAVTWFPATYFCEFWDLFSQRSRTNGNKTNVFPPPMLLWMMVSVYIL